MDAPLLKLADSLPDRLAALAEAANQPLSRLCTGIYGLTVAEWRVLATLGEHGNLTSVAVARRAHMHKVKVSRAITGLESKDLVERMPNSADMREAFVALTEKGAGAYRDLALQARDISAKLTARLSKPDKAALWRIMAVLEDSAVDENS
ncbi:MAG: MarR family transcriptional regulator [Rhodobiaceae bacterium]|nr:MarR family transcriptional regulator [Rhodobiaceae bacterium]